MKIYESSRTGDKFAVENGQYFFIHADKKILFSFESKIEFSKLFPAESSVIFQENIFDYAKTESITDYEISSYSFSEWVSRN